ncbi:hypothetical protein IQ270_05430 [Microcoleus sp. LEGE 07076]|uniref:hypothetical protein n=1 Tax=Microcoleus sp. LEGE 07076 TaxID=915322 RepID=UPI00187EDDE9|nr:hypothetical protein [Microcoleus sp. LEGE 07076]MBE9184176.1 hypothetical protein [Microcoleus sp. LEGE 07076]
MKVTVRDLEVFKSLDVNVIIAYLQKNGWHEHSRIYDNKGAIWVNKNEAGDVFDIALPLTREFADYPARMGDAVKTLELTENRSQLEILSDLITSLDNTEIQGFVVKVDREDGEKIAQVAMMGFVVNKLRKIYVELKENDCNLALKAYQDRIPVTCAGDLVKVGGSFVMQKVQGFALMLEEAKEDENALSLI